jgi:mannose-1-phosphate guanylyltransferase
MQKYNNLSALLLAAGVGSRLKPLTNFWPKCLMPIGQKPLLEYWLSMLNELRITKTLVNLHHHHEIVKEFLMRDRFKNWVSYTYEENLLGTAGTIRNNYNFFKNDTLLLIHADNWCQCDFSSFLDFHFNRRPQHCSITMMTFTTNQPSECGVVELDNQNIVTSFYEKVSNPPSNIANAAIYLIEPEALSWIFEQDDILDFSTQVLPRFIGSIASWHNDHIHRDIGTIANLRLAQLDPRPTSNEEILDEWGKDFVNNPLHKELS